MIYRQIEQVARQGVTARELDKARNQIRAQFVFGLQNNLHRAMRLAEYELYDGNAALLRTELDRYLAVTAADIQRVAGQYFTAANRTVLDVMPVARSAQEVTPGTAPAPTRPATPSTPTPARPPAPTAPAPTRPTTSNTPSAPPRPAAPAH